MGDVLDLAGIMRALCRMARLEVNQVRDVQIHGEHIAFELIDGSAITFLREDQADAGF